MEHVSTAPPIRTDDDLLARWRELLGPGGFTGRQLWLLWFDAEGYQLPVTVPIEGLPPRPDRRHVDNLYHLVASILDGEPGGTAAMALCRSGGSAVEPDDRQWGRMLLAAAAAARLPMRQLHLATTDSVRPLVADDLG